MNSSDHGSALRVGFRSALAAALLLGCSDVLGIRVLEAADTGVAQSETLDNQPIDVLAPTGTDPEATPSKGGESSGSASEAAPVPVLVQNFFGSYRFARGPESHVVTAAAGLLGGSPSAPSTLGATTLATARRGEVDVHEDGSFEYWPHSALFWGNDSFEYVTDSFQIRVRLTVQPREELDLNELSNGEGNGFVVEGGADFARSISGAGDLNGDGRGDMVIGQAALLGPEATGCVAGLCHASPGAAFVVFGSAETAPLLSEDLGRGLERGFLVAGTGLDDSMGYAVAGAGDTDGDGLDDLLVGAPFAGGDNYTGYGGAFLVFGRSEASRASTVAISLGLCAPDAPMRSRFFRGMGTAALTGYALASAGDANGNGRADLVVSTPMSNQVYVAFGGSRDCGVAVTDLSTTTQGYRVVGVSPFEGDLNNQLGRAIAGGGDFNGDGLDDIVIGADLLDQTTRDEGAAFIVFGKPDTSDVALDALGSGGFRITPPAGGTRVGFDVAAAGDVNGDGFADVLVGVRTGAGEGAYVVFGRAGSGTIALDTIDSGSGGQGFALTATLNDRVAAVAGAGDVDGDGLKDILVGGTPDPVTSAGRAYLIYGKTTADPVSLGDVRSDDELGFGIRGLPNDALGSAVASGDLNGDGLGDLLLGAPGASAGSSGRAYVVFGWDARGRLGRREQVLVGGAGDDSFDLAEEVVVKIAGGNGVDTLRLVGSMRTVDLRALAPRIESIERIDLLDDRPQAIVVDDAVLRQLPQSRSGTPAGLAKTLVVVGDADDIIWFDRAAYEELPAHEERRVYRRLGASYGLELSGVSELQAP